MRLFRVLPWDADAALGERGHPLWVPQGLQGAGRHDNPDLYGAMYLSERALGAVAESIAHLRGQSLDDSDLERNGRRLALVSLEAGVEGRLWDLDDPRTLAKLALRPPAVATRVREQTRKQAADLFRSRPKRDGIRWWSTIESSWIYVTLFDRALARISAWDPPEPLRIEHAVVRQAAEALGIAAA